MRSSSHRLRVAVAALALGLLALPGCPEDPVRHTGAVGPGSGPTGGTGSSGGSGPSSVATGGGGGQGGDSCLSCGEFFTGGNLNASLADTCGYDAMSQSCALGSSCDIIVSLASCVCGGGGVAGLCENECLQSCTGSGIDQGCQDCITAQCAGESTLCNADLGTP